MAETIRLIKKKETRNTIMFEEEGEGPFVLRTVYVAKRIAKDAKAVTISLTVELS